MSSIYLDIFFIVHQILEICIVYDRYIGIKAAGGLHIGVNTLL